MKPQRARVLLAITTVLLLLSSPSAGEVFFSFDDHLVAYWAFDNSGDLSPNDGAQYDLVSDDAAFSGDAGYSDGTDLPFGSGNAFALRLDGLDDYCHAPDSSDLDRAGSFTIAAWVRPNALGGEQNVLSKDTPGNFTNYNLHVQSWSGVRAFFAVTFDAPATCDGSATLGICGCDMHMPTTDNCYLVGATDWVGDGAGIWHHLAAVYEDGTKTLKLYLDGEEDGLATYLTTGSAQNNDSSVQIGHRKSRPDSDFDGLIDEVRLYDIALTAEQVLALASNDYAPRHACVGFEPPLASGPVTVRGSRALPFRAQLFDADGNPVTDLDVSAPPVIQVWYEYGTPDADDVTDEALPAGQSSEGNQFFFDSDQRWHYNLKTKNYSAAGTYTVLMDSGDESVYVVDPTCTGQFVVK